MTYPVIDASMNVGFPAAMIPLPIISMTLLLVAMISFEYLEGED